MHVPIPFARIARGCSNASRYYRTGVEVEGAAYLRDDSHGPWAVIGDTVMEIRHEQHIDVELSFWNRRGGRVTVLEPATIRILSREQPLAVADWQPFEAATLEEGGAPVTRSFALVPRDDPKARVEVSGGEVLELRFRPSRGSEKWAQPRIRLPLR
jgi:hypothetical protein